MPNAYILEMGNCSVHYASHHKKIAVFSSARNNTFNMSKHWIITGWASNFQWPIVASITNASVQLSMQKQTCITVLLKCKSKQKYVEQDSRSGAGWFSNRVLPQSKLAMCMLELAHSRLRSNHHCICQRASKTLLGGLANMAIPTADYFWRSRASVLELLEPSQYKYMNICVFHPATLWQP